ncbi:MULTISPECIES: class I SAM-dependent methyltransferase [unclassified Pseudomonas]|uniref:class I SAM-dependent methyltransferase n=1 Tax=unclassified Pseudomonas TaxID=196821 RepID=UPI00244C7538|nr:MULTISPECIES: class I SAM-dependent methyltransferase [unclassified Pseudomonas]MDG9925185.1 class I SAM-dependent methyltransferase [Pseudomonas sp. GD04045]MDH0035315.1 class I SAM-dependent methyltransferase [Pseudomonas sp. GD04019]
MRVILERLAAWWSRHVRPDEIQAVHVSNSPVDSRDCGLYDAVLGGSFNNATGELYPGFAVGQQDVVLDFGCGGGGATRFCSRQGAKVIFADSDASKIEQLSASLSESRAEAFQGIHSESLPLPLADACVNRVVAQEVLEHVEDPAEILAELFRLGMPGALYLLSVPHPRSERMQQGIAPDSHFEAPNHIHILEEEQFEHLVKSAGLEILHSERSGFYWAFWIALYWADSQAQGRVHIGATHDQIVPPYASLLSDWAGLWKRILQLPSGLLLKQRLDDLLPKSQVIIARKPT